MNALLKDASRLVHLTILLTVTAFMHTAHALDFRVLSTAHGRVLLLQDRPAQKGVPSEGFVLGDDERFVEWLRNNPEVSEIWFDSGGGHQDTGIAIGLVIRQVGLPTRVPKGAACASACADAFMGGVLRRVDDGARFGLHMPTVARDPEAISTVIEYIQDSYDKAPMEKTVADIIMFFEQLSANHAAKWGSYILAMGGSPRIVHLATATSANEMHWLKRRQLIDLNIINVID